MESFDGRGSPPPGVPPGSTRRRRSPVARLLPFVIFAIFAFVVLRNQVPAVDGLWQRFVTPGQWQAAEQCRRAALAAAQDPGFARILDRGQVHETAAGYYIEGIRVGEPGAGGGEVSFLFQCYTDRDGKVVKSVRQ